MLRDLLITVLVLKITTQIIENNYTSNTNKRLSVKTFEKYVLREIY